MKRALLAFLLTLILPLASITLWLYIEDPSGLSTLFGISTSFSVFLITLIALIPYTLLETTYIPAAILGGTGLLSGLGGGNGKNGFIGGLVGLIVLYALLYITSPLSSIIPNLFKETEFLINQGVVFGLLVIFPTIIGALIGRGKENE
ncbi:MAG: hypothetical protein GWO20_19190 [Candidatus Korarchaeota archaeon]|nr:hypothetical protein [Candidatus Korarchaeota archaeon]NIU85382.1 hypothetical protein [Candidatus Thorarchaeota archaeon]NIW15480.1 hypothetical protein [Candidatus Thorarchaeota archaeon]NIW53424.1 hypothetical protein [Candidatus Korarchaeota archaeon]